MPATVLLARLDGTYDLAARVSVLQPDVIVIEHRQSRPRRDRGSAAHHRAAAAADRTLRRPL